MNIFYMEAKYDSPQCQLCTSRSNSVFSRMTTEELEKMSGTKGCGFYKKGEIIFEEGKHPNGLYCIHKGKIKLYKLGKDGKEQIVRFAKDSNVIGYRALISGDLYSATAEALEPATICFLPKKDLFELMNSNAEFAMRMMRMLCQDLGTAEQRIVNLAQKPIRERLAEALLILKETFGTQPDERTLDVVLTREDLANIVGTATESVIRVLADFKSKSLIELNGKRIKIMDTNKLIEVGNVVD